MFHYLHCYMPETWEAQIKAGLINKNSGIRFVETVTLDEDRKFNSLAKKGGELYNILKERKCPFYVDRLQGGGFYEGYEYDFTLIDEYKKMLGDNFWGFQMHEWMTNFLSDSEKINDLEEPWTEESITKAIYKKFPYPHLFIEAVTAKEMAEFGRITDAKTYIAAMKYLFKKRQNYTGGMLIPCDSNGQGAKLEIELGAKRIMPEVGAQTVNARLQIAYARGMSRTNKIPFGIYYEPWGGEPFSAVCYQRDMKNEWNLGNESFPFKTEGENGGSSRSLQRRIHIYAYLAGAQFISEEWGMCNSFYDWKDFELTPYGKIKRDFIRFTEKYPDIGEIVTPVAIVLPEKLPAIESWPPTEDMYFRFPIFGKDAENMRKINGTIRKLLCSDTGKRGSALEAGTLLNYTTPDAIDVIHEDKEGDYDYYVDLTCSDKFKRTHNCIEADEVNAVLDKVLPITVKGKIHYFVNRAKDCCYLTVINNTGVERSVEKGEILLPEAEQTAEVIIKNGRSLEMLEGDSGIEYIDGKYRLTVPAGGWFFGRF